jgi:ATPase subunit of ABC transporter with duplicated ATPase domains
LRVLSGDDAASGGSLTFLKEAKLGVLRQDRFLDDTARIIDVAMQGDRPTFDALAELDRLAREAVPDAHRQSELGELVAQRDGYALESRASRILAGLGIATAVQKEPLGTLSGGYKLRVLLAQVLVGAPDVLLLDEPTNHLDIVSIRWLEGFLKDYAGCLVVVSHDHEFLDRVSTHILDVDYETITSYTGNYSAFVAQRQSTLEQKAKEIARQEKILAEKKAFVERFRAKATKARQAQSRAKQIEKMEIEELLPAVAALQLPDRAPERARCARDESGGQELRSEAGAARRLVHRPARGAPGHHRSQRGRQIDAAAPVGWQTFG